MGKVNTDEQDDGKKWLFNCHGFLRALVWEDWGKVLGCVIDLVVKTIPRHKAHNVRAGAHCGAWSGRATLVAGASLFSSI